MRDYKRMSEFLEIPREVLSKTPKITITGFDEILIENYKAILEYEDFFVRINTNIGIIHINGFNLKLDQMTDNDILVTGKIENLDFESKGEWLMFIKKIYMFFAGYLTIVVEGFFLERFLNLCRQNEIFLKDLEILGYSDPISRSRIIYFSSDL
mgnify:CR=1 FL=1